MPEQKFVLTFNGIDDRLELSNDFSSVNQAITIEFWAKGENDLSQPMSIFAAYNDEGNCVLNVHLPGTHIDNIPRILWDAGNENGYDRIDKEVQLEDYNLWTHWVFVKDTITQKMLIYRQGEIWHEGDGYTKLLAGISTLTLGCFINLSHYWKGSLAEFRIWDYARTTTEIQQDSKRFLVGNEPGLVVYLPLNGDGNDYSSSGNQGIIYGTTWTVEKLPFNTQSKRKSRTVSKSGTRTSSKSKSSKQTNDSASVRRRTSKSKSSKPTKSMITDEQLSNVETEELVIESFSSYEEMETTLPKNEHEELVDQESVNQELVASEPHKCLMTTTKKRLVVCCDGTGNKSVNSYPTNVLKFAGLIKYMATDQTPQIVSYLSADGRVDDGLLESLGIDALGKGIDRMIQDAYEFLCMNYDVDSQDEIYLVGFSRGAYIVRCLAGMIDKCGLLKRSKIQEISQAYNLYRESQISPSDPKAQQFRKDNSQKTDSEQGDLQYRIPIKMLGCWDTVEFLGIPDLKLWFPMAKLWNQKYQFLNTKISPIVENAFHAIAIDEKCKSFASVLMERNEENPNQSVLEVLFSGNHVCMGGGTQEYQGLSDYPLKWMINQAKKLGLEFYSGENAPDEFQIKLDPTTPFDNSLTGFYALGGEQWRPIQTTNVAIHYSVVERLKACPEYRPPNLDRILQDLLVTEATDL